MYWSSPRVPISNAVACSAVLVEGVVVTSPARVPASLYGFRDGFGAVATSGVLVEGVFVVPPVRVPACLDGLWHGLGASVL